jgi:cytochrome c oxidase subunit 4
VNLGTTVNLLIAVVIATIKASVVAAFFMHLAHDDKFHTIIFVSALVCLGVFVSFTMFDTEWRGRAEELDGSLGSSDGDGRRGGPRDALST